MLHLPVACSKKGGGEWRDMFLLVHVGPWGPIRMPPCACLRLLRAWMLSCTMCYIKKSTRETCSGKPMPNTFLIKHNLQLICGKTYATELAYATYSTIITGQHLLTRAMKAPGETR